MREITPTKTIQEPHESSLEQFVTHCRISYRSIYNNPRYVAAVVALADKLDEAEQSRDINHAAAKMALDQRDAIAAAALALVKKIDAIHASPDYEAVWALAGNRGLPYRGPNYSGELQALRAVLERGGV